MRTAVTSYCPITSSSFEESPSARSWKSGIRKVAPRSTERPRERRRSLGSLLDHTCLESHPWVDAAHELPGASLVQRLAIRTAGWDEIVWLEGRAFRRDVRVPRQLVEDRHNTAAERLHLGERVRLSAPIDGHERLPYFSGRVAGHEVPGPRALIAFELCD